MREWIRRQIFYWGDNKVRNDAFGIAFTTTVVGALVGVVTAAVIVGHGVISVASGIFWFLFGVGTYFGGVIGTKLLGAYGWSSDDPEIREEWLKGWQFVSYGQRESYPVQQMIHNYSSAWPGILLAGLVRFPFIFGEKIFATLNSKMEQTMDRLATPKTQKQLPNSRSD